MAVTWLHEDITSEALREFGFSAVAVRIVAQANVDVDEKQGQDASESNLHAMRGMVGDRMQDHGDAVTAVDAIFEARKKLTAKLIQASPPEILTALREMGSGLHTVQDRAFHNFEPWPFAGIGDSIFNTERGRAFGLASNYMLCHFLRDVGWAQPWGTINPSAFHYEASYGSQSGFSGYIAGEMTLSSSQRGWIPDLVFGGGLGAASGRFQGGLAIGLRWGPPPHGALTLHSSPEQVRARTYSATPPQVCPEAAQGVEATANAIRDSKRFVRDIRTRVKDTAAWNRFRSYRTEGSP